MCQKWRCTNEREATTFIGTIGPLLWEKFLPVKDSRQTSTSPFADENFPICGRCNITCAAGDSTSEAISYTEASILTACQSGQIPFTHLILLYVDTVKIILALHTS